MVKKRKEASPENNPVKDTPANPQEQFARVMNSIAANIDTLNANQNNSAKAIEKLAGALEATNQRVSNLAKTAPENKLNLMDIMKIISDILNSPVVKTLVDKIGGGEEAPLPPAEAPISESEREYLIGIKKANDALQNRWFEAMVKGQEVETAKKQKELGADW